MSTETNITLPDDAYALAKRHPWMLFKVKGQHYAHRKEVYRNGEVVSKATTVLFTPDNQDMSAQVRELFTKTIIEMEQGLT